MLFNGLMISLLYFIGNLIKLGIILFNIFRSVFLL